MLVLALVLQAWSVKIRTNVPDTWVPSHIDVAKVRENLYDIREEIMQVVGEQHISKAESGIPQQSASQKSSISYSTETKEKEHGQLITWFAPREVSAAGGEYILMNIVPYPESSVFCRFGNQIVPGWITTNGSISCKVPKLHNGVIPLAISCDREYWSNSVEIRCFSANRKHPFLAIATLAIIMAAIGNRFIRRGKNYTETDDDLDVITERGELNRDVRKRQVDRL